MLDSQTLAMMAEGTGATLYMTLMSTLFGYILGLPMGIILVVTAPKGLRPNQVVYRILDVSVSTACLVGTDFTGGRNDSV